jgi:hypothetical protein
MAVLSKSVVLWKSAAVANRPVVIGGTIVKERLNTDGRGVLLLSDTNATAVLKLPVVRLKSASCASAEA